MAASRAATFVGTAGWNIPRLHRHRVADHGSQLQRYASRLNAAEINTSFYRSHAPAIYRRWADAVPPTFRFSVKMPRLITHERALLRAREPLARFLDEIAALGARLGPVLVQLPPSFAFDARRVGRFFDVLRQLHDGDVVCEPRHATWTTDAATRILASFRVARVAADPARAAGLSEPGGWSGLCYFRWHGSPRPYFSPYSAVALRTLAADIVRRRERGSVRDDAMVGDRAAASQLWCIFDNTGSGAAAGNALDLTELLRST